VCASRSKIWKIATLVAETVEQLPEAGRLECGSEFSNLHLRDEQLHPTRTRRKSNAICILKLAIRIEKLFAFPFRQAAFVKPRMRARHSG
jgi:hypothetical protein